MSISEGRELASTPGVPFSKKSLSPSAPLTVADPAPAAL